MHNYVLSFKKYFKLIKVKNFVISIFTFYNFHINHKYIQNLFFH